MGLTKLMHVFWHTVCPIRSAFHLVCYLILVRISNISCVSIAEHLGSAELSILIFIGVDNTHHIGLYCISTLRRGFVTRFPKLVTEKNRGDSGV